QATGTVAEILGPREIRRDHGTRLFRFRGDLEQELNHYHPRGAEIIRAFVAGVNARIDEVNEDLDSLPLPFRLLGIQPKRWTPEVVISRHQGLLGNIGSELDTARAVCELGADKVRELAYFHPHEPDLTLHKPVDCEALSEDILALYNAYRRPVDFYPEDVVPEHRASTAAFESAFADLRRDRATLAEHDQEDIGSNNWVVSGSRTQDGYPMMVNDPHRRQAIPSLRYWVHLVGPGWNVIGGGEPEIPGVSIGHNEYGAWGLTVFGTDGEDLYVYETDPDNPDRYRYDGAWESMRIIRETIPVRGAAAEEVTLKYTRHGPVVFEDRERGLAYALRPAWMEAGGAPYLASLRMDQARNWEEFRDACAYSNIPGENMIWADREGNIGWQAVGIAPIRRNFSGMVPVPGDGRFEWDGYLPIKAKPHEYNPARGWIETSNSNYTAPDYPYLDAIGYTWSAPFRWARGSEVLDGGRKFNLQDMVALQHDYLSIPARTLVPLLVPIASDEPLAELARQRLLQWDHVLDADSVEAGIYVAFERKLLEAMQALKVGEAARPYLRVGMKRTIDFLLAPDGDFGRDPIAGRDALVVDALESAVAELRERFGPSMAGWRYGQAAYKHATIRHPLSPAVNAAMRERLDVGPVPRGGNGFTLGNTGSSDNQVSGASFRIFIDTRNWDATLGMNAPGQVGDPDSPLYDNLFELWAKDRVFPAFYSRSKIESVLFEKLDIQPARGGP
ncbi:MAG: penicillin acylase family protein, partial [Halieaceae bacterium]|nr:penicillin acylase family protein [Halieaceae bacterium]